MMRTMGTCIHCGALVERVDGWLERVSDGGLTCGDWLVNDPSPQDHQLDDEEV